MTRLLLMFVFAHGATACGGVAPLFCDEDTPCTDPDRPFCDLEGIYPGSDGHGRTCVPDPFGDDAGPDNDAGPPACDSRIAFVSSDENGQGVFVVGRDGQGRARFSPSEAESPDWSPNGDQLVYVAIIGQERVVAVQDFGNDPPRPFSDELSPANPRWSRDGETIVFARENAFTIESFAVADVATGDISLVERTSNYSHGTLSPTKATILVAKDESPTDLLLLSVAGSSDTNLTNQSGEGFYRSPQFSPNGQYIATINGQDPVTSSDVFIMEPDGSNRMNLSNAPGLELGLSWSPDSSQIAFDSDRSGENRIYTINIDGSGLRELSSGQGREPRWSPDGSLIAFLRGAELWVVDTTSANETRIATDVVFDSVSWEPCL